MKISVDNSAVKNAEKQKLVLKCIYDSGLEIFDSKFLANINPGEENMCFFLQTPYKLEIKKVKFLWFFIDSAEDVSKIVARLDIHLNSPENMAEVDIVDQEYTEAIKKLLENIAAALGFDQSEACAKITIKI